MRWFYDELVWMFICVLLLVCVAAVPFVRADEPVLEWEVAVICDQDKAPGFRSPGVEKGDIISFREANTIPWGREQVRIFCFYKMKATRSQMQALVQPVEDESGQRVKERRYKLSISTVGANWPVELTNKDGALEAVGIVDKEQK